MDDVTTAAGISRQAARKRWRDAAGTQWNLYTLTGPERTRMERGISLYRSREKAVSRGLYAVRQGQATTGGTFAAAVSDSTRTVVWACHFAPSPTTPSKCRCPEPADRSRRGSQKYTSWLHSWALHVDSIT
ncbi:hypothetical protein [Streptomyces sp. NPDC047869]|uniref:hypothetical protein n=1 Tax=Streptomyces sp. NPDC047869 TaxID=3154709 RepID=UPI003452E6BB